MMTYACPSCHKTLQSPDSQASKALITCPYCNSVIPVPAKGSSNLPLILGIVGGVGCLVAIPLFIVVCLAAISLVGTRASVQFSSIAATIGSGSNGSKPSPKDDKKDERRKPFDDGEKD